jgi:hypothetical protein
MKLNNEINTYEGGKAENRIPALEQLERQTATCMLWENTFYQSGEGIAKEIAETITKAVELDFGMGVANLARKARTDFKLRHVPLFMVRELCRHKKGRPFVADALKDVIRRPDEMGEFLAIYWKGQKNEDKEPLAASVKKGLAKAFLKFNEYQLSKWNKDCEYKLRDVLFLCHAKPNGEGLEEILIDRKYDVAHKVKRHVGNLLEKLMNGKLETPDTWEVALSGGSNKKTTWERLLTEKKLGYMAMLMNLRNMMAADVDKDLVSRQLVERAKGSWALPFRFVTAAKHAPALASALSEAMVNALTDAARIPGKTAIVVDVSGSMDTTLNSKSEMTRHEAAGALAVLCREVMENVSVFSFSDNLMEVPNYRGLPLIKGISDSQNHSDTYLKAALDKLLNKHCSAASTSGARTLWDRIIVITDEQSRDGISNYDGQGYIINVAPYAPGLKTSGGWNRINGWSERVVDWIRYNEFGQVGQPEIEE